MEELKKCAHCGGVAIWRVYDVFTGWAQCTECGISTQTSTREIVTEIWNRRVEVKDEQD